ncbi:MAG: bile acid:sodium symporter [Candidatus Tritonobacter lacicola]|nr:bile acid:sodium symporter [Candidatus Tritonobacter lacicola]
MNLSQVANLCTFLWFFSVMFQMGISVTFSEVLKSARQTKAVLKGIVTNILILPLIGFGILLMFNPSPPLAVGFLIAVIFSGASLAPLFTAIAKGDLPFSIGLMVILAIVSAFTSPWLLKFLVHYLVESPNLEINCLKIFKVILIGQLIPLSTGFIINQTHKQLAKKIIKPLWHASNVLFILTCILLTITQYHKFGGFSYKVPIGMMIMFVACVAIGWYMGGEGVEKRKAMALNSGVRNGPAAMVIAMNNYAGTAVPAVVFVYAIFSTISTLLVALMMKNKN